MAKKVGSRKIAIRKKSKPTRAGASKKAKAAGKQVAKKAVKKASKKAVKKAAGRPKKLKSPLTKGELEGFRNMLLEKHRSLIGDMGGIEAEALRRNRQESSGDLSNMPTHPADLGTDNYEYEFSLGLLESERALLGEINEALTRIDNRTYGICLGTGKPINKSRLRARPWAKYCIEYARMIEKGLVRPGEAQVEDELEEDADEKAEDSEDESAEELEE